MAQFDVHRLPGGQLVVDLQTDLIGIDVSRVVASLRAAEPHAALPALTPPVEIDGAEWIVRVRNLLPCRARDWARRSARWPGIATP